jgi:hypothetical protein
MTDERNDGLHPRHPGRGKCGLIEVESMEGRPEIGGFLIFLPSGKTKVVHWNSTKPLTPTLDAAKKYTAEVVDSLLKAPGSHGIEDPDVRGTNWTSVCAAVQRIVLDFNERITGAINAKMARDAIEGAVVKAGPPKRIVH